MLLLALAQPLPLRASPLAPAEAPCREDWLSLTAEAAE
jgi:hypothetical protein